MATTDRHIVDALEHMTAEQVTAWRQRCHQLGTQHPALTAPLTALSATGYDEALTAVAIAFGRCERDSLRDLALLLEQVWRAETDAGTRSAWRAARNLAWDSEMLTDSLGTEILNAAQGNPEVTW